MNDSSATGAGLSQVDAMTFAKDGALRLCAALDASDLLNLERAIAELPPDRAEIAPVGASF
jgi:hypothetical protein